MTPSVCDDFRKVTDGGPVYKEPRTFSSLSAEAKTSLTSGDCDLGVDWAANEFRMDTLPLHVNGLFGLTPNCI